MVYMCVRATTDWQNEEMFRRQLKEEFRPKVEAWNETFRMPYHIFRYRIKQIAQLNLSRVKNAVCATIDDIPNGAIVVPVDDDDWFSPELGNVLEAEFDESKIGYYWKRSIPQLEPDLFRSAFRFVVYDVAKLKPIYTCSTNNYAFIKDDKLVPFVYDHMPASRYFDREREKVKFIDMYLSVMNRSLASQTSLAWGESTITKRELKENFHKYKVLYSRIETPELVWSRPYVKMMTYVRELKEKIQKKALYARTESPELAWSRPYVKMMADLMKELELR